MANSTVWETTSRVGASTDLRRRTAGGLLLRLRTRLRRHWLDNAIARCVERPDDQALALREAQLVGSHERRRLATRLEGILTERARAVFPTSAVPIDHKAVGVAKPVLSELILSLRSSEAVEARGVVLAWRLLTDAASPIYAPPGGQAGDVDRLWHESWTVLFALTPLSAPVRASVSAP
jgi:hypothetical protein